MAEETEPRLTLTDHELLILMRRDMKYMREDVDEIRKKLAQTAPLATLEDHEARIRTLEGFRWWILGGGASAAFVGGMLAHLIWR